MNLAEDVNAALIAKNKKIKMFSKTYKDMQESVKKVLKKPGHKTYHVSKIREVDLFCEQMDKHVELFNNHDAKLLKSVVLLHKFFIDKQQLTSANLTVVWKYLEALYSIAKGQKIEATPMVAPVDMNGLGSLVGGLMADKDNGLSGLIKDITSKLEKDLAGKNVDQAQLIQDLMSGKTSSSGIDFGSIMAHATQSLKSKVDSGEVDADKIKGIADQLQGVLNIKKEN
jgi:hypothetical protein